MDIKHLSEKFMLRSVIKDVICISIKMWFMAVLFCSAFENGWLPRAVGTPCNLSVEEFSAVYLLFWVIGMSFIVIRIISGGYKAMVFRMGVLNKSEQLVELNEEE